MSIPRAPTATKDLRRSHELWLVPEESRRLWQIRFLDVAIAEIDERKLERGMRMRRRPLEIDV